MLFLSPYRELLSHSHVRKGRKCSYKHHSTMTGPLEEHRSDSETHKLSSYFYEMKHLKLEITELFQKVGGKDVHHSVKVCVCGNVQLVC